MEDQTMDKVDENIVKRLTNRKDTIIMNLQTTERLLIEVYKLFNNEKCVEDYDEKEEAYKKALRDVMEILRRQIVNYHNWR